MAANLCMVMDQGDKMKALLDDARANGIEIFEYKPLQFPWVQAVFNRDHRKS